METTIIDDDDQQEQQRSKRKKRDDSDGAEVDDPYDNSRMEWVNLQEKLSALVQSIEAMAEKSRKPVLESNNIDDDNNDDKKSKATSSIPMPTRQSVVATATTVTATRNNKKLRLTRMKDCLDQLSAFHNQLKKAADVVADIRQETEDDVDVLNEESSSTLISLGGDILSRIMRYLDEDALLQCEFASLTMNKISRGRNVDHWEYLYSFHQAEPDGILFFQTWGPILKTEYSRSPIYFSQTKKLETITTPEVTTKFKFNCSRYYGIIAAKAREFEDHARRLHPYYHRRHNEDRNDDDDDVDDCSEETLCSCDEFEMKLIDFESRIHHDENGGEEVFVCFSRREEESNHVIWQGWCRYDYREPFESPMDQTAIVTLVTSSRIPQSRWPGLHRIQNDLSDAIELFRRSSGTTTAAAANTEVVIGGTASRWPGLHRIQNDLDDAIELFRRASETTTAAANNEVVAGRTDADHNEQEGKKKWKKWIKRNREIERRLMDQVEPLAENLRVTVVNRQGQLIVTSGEWEELHLDNKECVGINFFPMRPHYDEEKRHIGVSTTILIHQDKITMKCEAFSS